VCVCGYSGVGRTGMFFVTDAPLQWTQLFFFFFAPMLGCTAVEAQHYVHRPSHRSCPKSNYRETDTNSHSSVVIQLCEAPFPAHDV
jgi:hypothetical protein